MDVHPPHESAHSVGDFFLHLFTIIMGLLIAVGIEGAVTRHEHKKLADETRETDAADAPAERLGNWEEHLLNIHIAAMVLEDEQGAYLEGREPTRHMSMSLHD